MNKQQLYIAQLQKVLATPIQVANLIYMSKTQMFVPGQRFNADKYELHDERNVALNEVVFDLDWSSYIKNYNKAISIIEVLERRGIPHLICCTGGKGIHLHIFFNKISLENPKHKEIMKKAFSYGLTWKHIRKWIWNVILDEAGIEESHRGPGKFVDSKPITFNYFGGTTHLIRDIGGCKKEKNKDTGEISAAYKSWIPKEDFNKTKPRITNIKEVRYPKTIESFDIDENELISYLERYINICKDKNIQAFKNERLKIAYLNIDGLLKVREGLSTGQRSTGAMLLCVAGKIDQKAKKDMIPILDDYAKKCSQSGHGFTLAEAEQWLIWVYNQEHVYWNCSQLEELGVHDPASCEFCQSKNKEALSFLANSTMLNQIEELLDIEVVGEKETKLLIFLLMLSKSFPSKTGMPDWNAIGDPVSQNVILSSDSGAGKTYVVKKILELLGEEDTDYYIKSRISKSAINYYTEINMDGKVIFIEELQGLDENTSQLRVWMSEGKLTLDTVEKEMNDEGIEVNTLIKKTTKGQPVFVTCQAEGVVEEQLNNRSWVISLDISEVQTEHILDYQDEVQHLKVKTDVVKMRVIKDAIRQLKPYHFTVPYANHRAMGIPIKEVRARRDYEKLMTLIKCSAYLHQKQREIKIVENKEYLICDIKDYEVARRYSQSILGATFSGLTNSQIDIIKFIRSSSWKIEFTIADIQRNKGKSQTHWAGQFKQLENLGYITAERSLGKSTIYSLVENKAFNIISLPSGDELLQKISDLGQNPTSLKTWDLTPTNAIYMESGQGGINKSHLYPDFRFGVFGVAMYEKSENNPKVKSLNAIMGGHLPKGPNIGSRSNFYFGVNSANKKEVLSFIRDNKAHLVKINDIKEKFGDESEKIIGELLKEGEIFQPKKDVVMLL